MLKELFSSKARIAVLKLFLLNQARMFYQREIASRTHLPIRAVQREVTRLVRIGLIERSVSGNRVYYQVNPNCPIYPDLKSLILKTTGIARILKQYISRDNSPDIRLAFIYGSYAKNTEDLNSDIDLLLIGNLSSRKLSSLLAPVKSELNREINFALYSEREFKTKLSKQEHFLTNLEREPKVFLIGTAHDFKRITQ